MAENEKRCQVEMSDDIPCGRELYDEEYCIFHSKKFNKDVRLFQKGINESFEDKFLRFLDFSKFIFPKDILFPERILKTIIFRGAVFQYNIAFQFTTFQCPVDFGQTTFKGDSDFRGNIFHKSVNFKKSNFERMVNFGLNAFQDQIDFDDVTFYEQTYFFNTVFKKYVSFERAVFKEKSAFLLNTFHGGVIFRNSTFEDTLMVYEGKEGKDNKIFSLDEVNFKYVKFFKPEKVSFQKINLSMFRFLGTDLRKVEFADVDWYKEKGRNKIYDEVSPDPETKNFDYPLIAQVYKRLRANYEENLNYAEAGDFHIGEMEMRRKGEKNPFNKAVIWLYKLISNYGESYWRPLLRWILPILLLFPFLFMYSGIEQVTSRQSPYMIHYQFNLSSISLSNAGDFIKDYLKSFVYSLSVFSLVREKLYRPISNLGHFWMVLESIFSPVMIAFFLLALRRRFKR